MVLKRDGTVENGASEAETPVEAEPETAAVCCLSFLSLFTLCMSVHYGDALQYHAFCITAKAE